MKIKAILTYSLVLIWLFGVVSTMPRYASAQNLSELDPLILNDLEEAIGDLFRMTDFNHTIYIGIGRSPTPFIAAIQSIDNQRGYMIPLSNFYYSPGSIEKRGLLAKLHQHFANFLPPVNVLNKIPHLSIELVDFVSSGESFAPAFHYIEQYYQQQGLKNVSLHATVLSKQPTTNELLKKALNGRINIIDLQKYPELAGAYKFSAFDNYAPYGSYDIAMRYNSKGEKVDVVALSASMKHDAVKQSRFQIFKESVRSKFEKTLIKYVGCSTFSAGMIRQ